MRACANERARPALVGDLSAPVPIPERAIERVTALLRDGRLHRYGETRNDLGEAARLEQAFADYIGSRYAVAANSGGAALFVAMKAAGVMPGEPVAHQRLHPWPRFPAPSPIWAPGRSWWRPTEALIIDLADLERKIATSGARCLLLSPTCAAISATCMAIVDLCDRHGILLDRGLRPHARCQLGRRHERPGSVGSAASACRLYKHT